MTMFIHFFCLCPLSLTIKRDFDISKVAYCVSRCVICVLLLHIGFMMLDITFGSCLFSVWTWSAEELLQVLQGMNQSELKEHETGAKSGKT